MKNTIHNARPWAGKGPSKTPSTEADRRSAQRQTFIAEAHVAETSSGTRLVGRTSDLTIYGCYIDSLNVFPVGTLVRIRLKKGEEGVEVNGNVVYQMSGLGMGIVFRDLSPENHSALEGWVSQTTTKSESHETWTVRADPAEPAVMPRSEGQFVELVRLLVKKGVLTESEASGLLKAAAVR